MGIFRKGLIALIISAFLAECIELLVNMVLARELGSQGLGRYMTILPSIFLVFLLASLEIPVSLSKFIAEKEEKYHRNILFHAIRITIILTIILLIAGTAVISFIPIFDSYHPFTRWLLILLIPIVSMSAVSRGYFMGRHQVGKIAAANMLKRLCQLGALFMLFRFLNFQQETSLVVAFGTLIGSEVIVFVYLMSAFLMQYQEIRRKPFTNLSGGSVRDSLMKVSVPVTAMRLFYALISAIQPFLIKSVLVHSGLDLSEANAEFGMLTGMAMAIGFFPAFIAHSLLIVLIPSVSKAFSQKNYSLLKQLLQQVLMVTIFYGLPASACFYFFARPLTVFFFNSDGASVYVQRLWPFFLFHYLIIPMQAYLIGLGLMKDAFLHTLWATAVSFSLVFWLGSMPEWRMDGIIIGMNTEAILLASLHFLTIYKIVGINLFNKNLIPKIE